LVILKAARDKVKFGVLDPDERFVASRRAGSSDSGRGTVRVIAPFGEELEIDG
jgi:hypothetical protein